MYCSLCTRSEAGYAVFGEEIVPWKTVAVGTSIADLKSSIADIELKKGDKIKVVMDTWTWPAFDIFGAELLFKPFVPEGVDLIDVSGENGYGIVEMEADPIWFGALLGFIKAHWLAIAIGGAILAVSVAFIWIYIKISGIVGAAMPWLMVGGIFILGYGAFKYIKSRSP